MATQTYSVHVFYSADEEYVVEVTAPTPEAAKNQVLREYPDSEVTIKS